MASYISVSSFSPKTMRSDWIDRVGDLSLLCAELRSCRARRRRGGGDVDCVVVGIVDVEVVEIVESRN